MVTDMLWLPDALTEAGVNVKVLDGWHTPQKDGTYLWREDHQIPAGHMHHHTASTGYTPNRDKANGYAGLGQWESDRLYQSGDAYEPFYVIANAYPAPISSGYGCLEVLDDYVRRDEFILDCPGPDGDTAGNTHFWNTEYVLDGIGTWLDGKVWDMMVTVSYVIGRELGWTPYRNIAHGTWTRRKIDLWDGRYTDFVDTLRHLQWDIGDMDMEQSMSLERYASMWRNPQDFDAAVAKGIILEAEAVYWKTVPVDSPEWQDLHDAVLVRSPLWS